MRDTYISIFGVAPCLLSFLFVTVEINMGEKTRHWSHVTYTTYNTRNTLCSRDSHMFFEHSLLKPLRSQNNNNNNTHKALSLRPPLAFLRRSTADFTHGNQKSRIYVLMGAAARRDLFVVCEHGVTPAFRHCYFVV